MKNIVLSIFLLLAFMANAQISNLQVFSEDGNPFYLILNGIRQNFEPETNVSVQGLTAAYIKAKIIFADQGLGEIDKNLTLADPLTGEFGEVSYVVKMDKKGLQTCKFFSFTPVAQIAPPPPNVTVVQYNTSPMPPPVFGTNVQVTETTTTSTMGSSENVNMGVNLGGFNVGVNVNVNDGFGGTVSQTSSTTTTTTTVVPVTPVVVVPVVQEPVCNTMNAASFNSLLNSINSKTWDDDKLTVAKQATSANCLTSQQIKQVMSTFQWEDNRLAYAKYAYAFCYDPNNYYQVNDAFEWSDSVSKLNSHIGR